MRKLDAAIDALFLAAYQILSCMVIYFATWMGVKIVSGFVELDFLTTNLIYSIAMGIGVGVLLVIYAYKATYRAASLVVSESVLSSALAVVIHLLLTAAFSYTPLIGGAALPLSGVILFGNVAPEESTSLGFMPLILFLAIMVIYHTLMLFVRKLALNRRLIDRYELTGTV